MRTENQITADSAAYVVDQNIPDIATTLQRIRARYAADQEHERRAAARDALRHVSKVWP